MKRDARGEVTKPVENNPLGLGPLAWDGRFLGNPKGNSGPGAVDCSPAGVKLRMPIA
jgi:hypothetical protein